MNHSAAVPDEDTQPKLNPKTQAPPVALNGAAEPAARRRTDPLLPVYRFTASLANAVAFDQIVETIVVQAVRAVGAAGGALLLAKDGALQVAGRLGSAAVIGSCGSLPLAAKSPATDVYQARQPLWLPGHEAFAARYPDQAQPGAAPACQAQACWPLVAHGQILGVLLLWFAEVKSLGPFEAALLDTVAHQSALALVRARLYEAERRSRHELEAEVARRTAELRAEVERRRSAQQQLERSREAERARVARELHDELGGALTSLKMELARLRRLLPADDPKVQERLAAIHASADEMIQTVRRLAHELRPALLDQLGLVAAIEAHFQEFVERTGLAGEFVADTDYLPLSPEAAIACFRIVQEALTNVARHAQATRVSVTIEKHDHDAVIRITDNGRGFDLAARDKTEHLGIIGMQERAEPIAAALAIASKPGHGTTVLLKVPLEPAAA